MNNKTVLITGAAKRIGATIARQLHQAGMDIIIHYHSSAKEANDLLGELNQLRTNSATTLQANLDDYTACKTLIENALKFNNRLDVLVNNASVFFPTKIATLAEKDWDKIISINLKAPLFLSHFAANYLRVNHGCIVNITDIHGTKPLAEHIIYSTSKSGLITLTQSLAKELAPAIRVNAISPGAITWTDNMDEKRKQDILKNSALARQGSMTDISKAVLFLVNDADYITGQILNIDGGRILY